MVAEPNFKKMPFPKLIIASRELSQLRFEYSSKSGEDRRKAADFAYNEAVALYLFNQAMPSAGMGNKGNWPEEVTALAIDPLFAPAILTVGSYEYLYKRKNEAMKQFLSLITLCRDEEDIFIMIDKAGDFLIEQKDYKNALALYSTAVREFPDNALLHIGLGYCFEKLGQNDEAIKHERLAVELEPDNYKHLTDLGWSLVEIGRYEEAIDVLERAVKISPPDYNLSRANLEELQRRMAMKASIKTVLPAV